MRYNIIEHSQTDPNAPKHMILGFLTSFWFGVAGLFVSPEIAVYAFLFGGFIMGVTIETVQRIQRRGRKQNTWNESLYDALVTGFWPLLFWNVWKGKLV